MKEQGGVRRGDTPPHQVARIFWGNVVGVPPLPLKLVMEGRLGQRMDWPEESGRERQLAPSPGGRWQRINWCGWSGRDGGWAHQEKVSYLQ